MHKTLILGLTACLLLSACEAIELINSVGTILGPLTEGKNQSESTSEVAGTAESPTTNASPNPVASAPATEAPELDVVVSSDPTPVSTDWNLLRSQKVNLTVSSTLSQAYAQERLKDGNLDSSWFAATADQPGLGKLPSIELSFAEPVGILSINLRGDRERSQGLKIQELSVLINSTQGILLNETVSLPEGSKDVNLVLKKPLDEASSLRLTVTRAQEAPGLAELEILGRP